MLIANIHDFTNGWIIGNFQPSIIQTEEFEVAHHSYPAGFEGEPHIHKKAVEINYVLKGKVMVNSILFSTGDIWTFAPNEYHPVKFLEDTELIIIKTPSIPGDKYPCSQS